MSRKKETRRGAAAVECAIILPFLLLLLVGVWEVGRLVEVEQLLNNATREGGRMAATGIKTSSEVKQVVVTYLNQNGVTGVSTTDVTIENLTDPSRADPTQANQLDRFRVKVEIPFNNVRWVLINQITSVSKLSSSSDWYSMRDIPLVVDPSIPLN